MKFIKIDSKRFSPKRLFGHKKDRSAVNRSEPPSFGSGLSSSTTSDSSSVHKPGPVLSAAGYGTPTSVLPQMSGDWSEFSSDANFDLVHAFRMLDKDKDGVVTREELEALLCSIGADPPSQEEITMMLREVDRDGDGDGDGSVRLETLMNRFGSVFGPACDVLELRETFEVFDTDNDGRISAEELLRVFSAIGDDECTLEDCRNMIAGVDKNGDGFVCFEDFARMMELQR